jgi:hypothetical protein
MKRYLRLISVVLLALLPLSGLVTASSPAPSGAALAATSPANWRYQLVDGPKIFSAMGPRSLAIDAALGGIAGYPHIAYGGDHLYYAWQDGSGWHREVADSSPGVGAYASLALDAEGSAHVAYYDSIEHRAMYAYRRPNGSWFLKVLSAQCGGDLALALDSAGDAHVVYRASNYRELRYVYAVGDGYWSDEEVIDSQAGGLLGAGVSLALDAQGHPHVAYDGSAGLKYAFRDAQTGWHSEAVLPSPISCDYTSIVVDTYGRPNISYYLGGMQRHLGYGYRDALGWHCEIADDTAWAGWYSSLCLDAGGAPHISYAVYDQDNYRCKALRYTVKTVSGWQMREVESAAGIGYFTSLASPMAGYWDISYYDNANRTLKLAHYSVRLNQWSTAVLDSAARIGDYNSLAVDRAGNSHISYQVAGQPSGDHATTGLWYAYHPAGASRWYTQPLDVGDVGDYNSLAVDGYNEAHVAYYDHANGDLLYITDVGEGHWSDVEKVDTAGDVGAGCSLALDDAGRSHISYCLRKPGGSIYCDDLRYAYKGASGWVISTVDAPGDVGDDSAIALDADGYPHIVYLDRTNKAIKHAYKLPHTVGWQIETLPGSGEALGRCAIAIDADGRVHVVYALSPYGAETLKYAIKTSRGWHTESLGNAGDLDYAPRPALVVDRLGQPHISYYSGWTSDGQNEGLWYLREVGNRWEKWLVADTALGGPSSLALDGAGRAHISYVDLTCRDLRYAILLARVDLPRLMR